MSKVKLYEIAHSRAGDKGEVTNLSLIPYEERHYELLKEKITETAVKDHFGQLATGEVVRYELEGIGAFNFIIYGTRTGGVAAALDFDAHGKSLSWALLEMEIEIE